jgi:hypothetical protein
MRKLNYLSRDAVREAIKAALTYKPVDHVEIARKAAGYLVYGINRLPGIDLSEDTARAFLNALKLEIAEDDDLAKRIGERMAR